MRILPLLSAMLLIAGCDAAARAAAAPAEVLRFSVAMDTVQQARKVMMNDPAAAFAMGRDLEKRAAGVPDGSERRAVIAKAKWIAGEAALRLNRIDQARRLIDDSYALARASSDPQSQGDALLSRGSIKSETGDPAGALQDYLAAHQLFLITKDARSQSVTLQYLSELYAQARDYKRAENYLLMAADAYPGDPMLQLSLANNLGNLFNEQKLYRQAEMQFQRGLVIARRLDVDALQITLLNNLALGQIKQKRLAAAASTVASAMAVSRRVGNGTGNELRLTLAKLAFAQGRIGVARRTIDQILARPTGKAFVHDEAVHDSAYEIYKAAGEGNLALGQLEIANRLRNEAVALSISNTASLMAARFDYAAQDLRIARLKANELQRNVDLEHTEASRQRMILVGGGIAVLAVMGVLAIWLAMLQRSRNIFRAVNAKLEQANTSLQSAFHEVGQRAQAEQRAVQLAEHDALTGLPNRRQLYEDFQDGLQGRDDPDRDTFVLLVDLDRFKAINDIHGHAMGDLVLVATANRLRTLCSQNDAKAARLGGDEFVVVMMGPGGDNAAERLSSDIIRDINVPFDIGDRLLTLGASIGIARYPHDGDTIEKLLRAADIAMYEAKRSGKNTSCFFDAAMEARLHRRASIEADLRLAIQSEQIEAYFQPIYCFRTDAITGFEALARWEHNVRGSVSPVEFISVAEEVGLIEDITIVILRQACLAARDWPEHISVSVNLSPVLLRDPWITAKVFGILAHERIPPDRLIIEVTETAVIDHLELASDALNTFRDAGIRIALDDFGTGYSSLSHLRQINFDQLKLDASFVLTMHESDSMKITTAVAGLGQALGIPVTAEGVETAEVAAKLRELGFSYGQGYLYGEAVPRAEAHIMVAVQDHSVGRVAHAAACSMTARVGSTGAASAG